jgi:hypothetical protein
MSSRTSLDARAAVAAAVLAATVLVGCGVTDPYASNRATTASGPSATVAESGDPPRERGGTVPPAAGAADSTLAADPARSTPRAALIRYAQLYVNWSARDVLARQRQLASISLGQARAQALQAAASVQRDKILTRSRVANTGQVVGVAPGEGAAEGQWVVVTREQTTGQGDYAGLPPTVHVTFAKLVHTQAGWVITSWSAQN